MRKGEPVRSRTVDSRPKEVGPLSRIRSILPSRSAQDVLGPGRGKPVRAIGAGGRERLAHPFDQAPRHRRQRHSQRHRLPAAGDNVRNQARPVEHQRQRTRPERAGEAIRGFWPSGSALPRLADSFHVNDERIEGRPSFGVVNPVNGGGIGRQRAQAVDGFGRERDQTPSGQHVGCVRQGTCGGLLGINLDHSGLHQAVVTSQSSFFRAEGSGGFSPRAWKSVLSPS